MRATLFALLIATTAVVPRSASAQTQGGTTSAPAAGTRILPSSPSDDVYQLGPEDVLQLQVWGRPELSGPVTVGFSGVIQAPLLGMIRVAGRTPKALTKDLTERYQLLDPRITEVLASVAEYNSLRITFLGAVGSPGVYGFREMPDLWTALLTAGGPTQEAELSQVQIVRDRQMAGESRTVRLNLSRGIDGTPAQSLPELRPKDTIMVPFADEVTAVGDDTFQVLGAVNAPGVYRLFTARTVLDAITVSGGPSAEANLGSVHLLRTSEDGAISYRIDLERLINQAEPLSNLDLQAGDTISVPEASSFFTDIGSGLRVIAPFLSLATTIILASSYRN